MKVLSWKLKLDLAYARTHTHNTRRQPRRSPVTAQQTTPKKKKGMAATLDHVTKTVADNYRELSKGGQVVKKILLASNALVMLFGLLLIIVGGVAAGGQFNGLTSTTLASGIIVIGVFVMVIALLGAWGAMVENKVLLYIYFALLIFFALVEFSVGIAAYVRKDTLPDIASAAWTQLYNTDRNAIDDFEKSFQCCGWNNITDRSVPPLGTESTCASLYPGVGACSTFFYDVLQIQYGNQNDPTERLGLENYQKTHQCCGWMNLEEAPTSYWVPLRVNSTVSCLSVYAFTTTCFQMEQNLWYTNYHSSTPAGDAYVLFEQSEYITNGCCGWLTVTDAAVPPYTNNTCILTKGFNQPCSSSIDTALMNSLQITGGVGIALAIIEIATIILTLVLIIKIPAGGARASRHDEANAGVMEELHDEE